MRQEDEQNNARRSAASGGRVPKQLSSQRVRRHRFEENIPSVWEEEPQKDARVRNRRKADRNLVDREIYDYSHAAIRSDWGSQQAERAARQAAGKFGDAGEKSRVQLRKESEFPSHVIDGSPSASRERSASLERGADGRFGNVGESGLAGRRKAQPGQRDLGFSYGFMEEEDSRQAARERIARRRERKAAGASSRRSSDVSSGPSAERFTNADSSYRRRASSRFAGMGTASSMAPASHLASSKSVDAPDTDGDSYGFSRSSAFDAPASYSRDGYGRASRKAQHPQKRGISPRVLIGVIVAAVLLAVGIFAAVSAFAGSGENSSTDSDTQMPAEDSKQAVAPSSDNLVMNLNGDAETVVLKGEDYIESGCHVINKKTGTNLTGKVKTEGNVDTSKAGDYTITYSVSDDDGATLSKERTVHVVDNMDADTDGISVLMYHYVYTASDAPDEVNGNYVLDTDLDKQLEWLQTEGYYFPSYEELSAYIAGKHSLPKKSVVVTFDDGETGFLEYGIPLLEKHQVPATSFVIASDSDAADKVKNYASEYVSFQSHSYAMHQAGSNVGRGGRIHAMTQAEILDDLQKAAAIVQNNEAMAYPFGDNNETAHAAIREAGILCAFTINNNQVHVGDDPTCLSRVRISGEYSLDSFIYSVENGVG